MDRGELKSFRKIVGENNEDNTDSHLDSPGTPDKQKEIINNKAYQENIYQRPDHCLLPF